MPELLDTDVLCGHCKKGFKWRVAYVQRQLSGAAHGRERPRVFCPNCGFLVADTPVRDSTWAWHGDANALGNPGVPFCPPGASGWGHARIKGVERPLPLVIPDSLATALDETFIDVRVVRAAILKPPLVSKPPVLAVKVSEPLAANVHSPGGAERARELLRLAIAKIGDNDFAGASHNLDEALALQPRFAEALCARGYAKGELGELADALRDYSGAIEADPSIADAHCGRAFVKALSGDEEGAIADFSAALRVDRACVSALVNRAILCSRHKPEEAVRDLTRVVEFEPGNVQALLLRGVLSAKAGAYERALEDFREAVRRDPSNVQAHYYKGMTETKSKQPELAVKSFDRALELDADDSDALFGRGAAKIQLGKNEAALQDLTKSLDLDPGNGEALCRRGIALYRLGRFDAAIADHGAALAIDPKNAVNLYSRGLAFIGAGKHAAALPDFDAALKLDPKMAEAYHACGLARAKLGKNKEAAQDFSKLIELQPGNPEAFYQRGLARKAAGDAVGADKDFVQSGKLKESSQAPRRLISEEKDVQIATDISRNRGRARRYLATAIVLAGGETAFGIVDRRYGWPHLDWWAFALIVVFPLTVRQLIRFAGAYDQSKGNSSLESRLEREGLGNAVFGAFLYDHVRFMFLLPRLLFGSKRCQHCKTVGKFYSRRCRRCGASQ